ncbi:MAG: hypothetical protein ACJ75J_08190 [Cytophagaceae bacterium]
MKRYLPGLALVFFFASCQKATTDQSPIKDSLKTDTSVSAQAIRSKTDSLDLDDSEGNPDDSSATANESATFYLITLTEGYKYDSLQRFAKEAARKLHLDYDQMDRIYKPGKGIVVKDDDDDEMYRGQYYPRRFSGNFVSIEMKSSFIRTETDAMKMLVISNIFEKSSQADSALTIVKAKYPSAQKVETVLYTGCMH